MRVNMRTLPSKLSALVVLSMLLQGGLPAKMNAEDGQAAGPQSSDTALQLDLEYTDNNPIGSVSGTLRWWQTGGFPAGAKIKLLFLTEDGDPAGSPIGLIDAETQYYILPVMNVPPSATRIGAQLLVMQDGSGVETVIKQQSVPIWYYNAYMPVNWKVDDTDLGEGMDLLFTWTEAQGEAQTDSYLLTYKKHSSDTEYTAAVIPRNASGDPNYSYLLAEPASDAVSFNLHSVNARGEKAPVRPYFSVNDKMVNASLTSSGTNALNPISNFTVEEFYSTPSLFNGSVGGRIPYSARSSVYGYKLYFGSSSTVKLKPIVKMVYTGARSYESNDDSIRYYTNDLTVPAGATHLLMATIAADGSESSTLASWPLSTPPGEGSPDDGVPLEDRNADGHVDIADAVLEAQTPGDKNNDGITNDEDVLHLLGQLEPRGIPIGE